jgi:pimeloyl-ACP methyl ester carboxylesterase
MTTARSVDGALRAHADDPESLTMIGRPMTNSAELDTLIDQLPGRLAADGIVRGLLAPGSCRILFDLVGRQFGIVWTRESGLNVLPDVTLNDTFDFSFSIPPEFWERYNEPVPPPRFNTAQALVANSGGAVVGGDRIKWAQYIPLVERVLACLRSPIERRGPQELPSTSAIVGRYIHVDVDGFAYRLYYESAGAGTPLICIHTAGSDSRQYKHLLEDIELQQSYQMIALDLPWHGRSAPPRGWRSMKFENSVDHALATIRAFIGALGLERPLLMGCSLGGALSLAMASRHGDEFSGILSLEGALGTNPDIPPRRIDWTRHMEIDRSMFLSTWVAGLMAPVSPDDLRDEILWEYAQGGPGVYNGDGHLGIAKVASALGPTKCPLYVFSGDYDYAATPAMSKAAADQLGGEFVPMKGMGHFPMAEDPAAFKKYLMPVLSKLASNR